MDPCGSGPFLTPLSNSVRDFQGKSTHVWLSSGLFRWGRCRSRTESAKTTSSRANLQARCKARNLLPVMVGPASSKRNAPPRPNVPMRF